MSLNFEDMKAAKTIKEVGAILHLCDKTLYRWIKDGRIAATKIGNNWVIPSSEIERLWREGSNCGSEAVSPKAAPLAATRLSAAEEMDHIINGSLR
jgi:excisionase family DNA binding protein